MPHVWIFGGKEYDVGETYTFAQLPRIAKRDAILSDPDQDPESKWTFQLSEMSPADAKLWLRNMMGDEPYEDEFDSPRTRRLMKLIPKEGLKSPPLGTEGVHRMLAMIRLGWRKIPVFEIVE